MTRPKKSELPSVNVFLENGSDGRIWVSMQWRDEGKERVSARITKALKHEGFEAKAKNIPYYSSAEGDESLKRICVVVTPAPLPIVEAILTNHFLNVNVDRTLPADDKASPGGVYGTAVDLIRFDEPREGV